MIDLAATDPLRRSATRPTRTNKASRDWQLEEYPPDSPWIGRPRDRRAIRSPCSRHPHPETGVLREPFGPRAPAPPGTAAAPVSPARVLARCALGSTQPGGVLRWRSSS